MYVCMYGNIKINIRIYACRYYILRIMGGGEETIQRMVGRFKPVTIAALLLMLVLIFIFQGECMYVCIYVLYT